MVSIAQARTLALSLAQAVEGAHQGHPDFRVHGKIFATLRPDEQRMVVKLTAVDQEALLAADPDAFATNAWSKQGALEVRLERISIARLRELVEAAWCQVAPKRLVARYQDERRNR